jgi:invasion protein IalB
LGVALEPGLRLLVDKEPAKDFPYRTCNSVGCIAVADFDDKLANTLDNADTVKIALASLDGQQQQVTVSLKGYHQARSAYKSAEAHRHNWFWRLWS